MLSITTVDGTHNAWIFTIPSEDASSARTPQLAFEDFDHHHFLSRVTADNGIAREIVLTEPAMKREIARTTHQANN